jgi:hypothetical protein
VPTLFGMASHPRSRLLAGAVLAAVFALTAGAADAPARGSAAPANNGTPTITGLAVEGQTITGHNGSWFCDPACVPSGPEDRGGYEFQWQRCNAAGTQCSNIEDEDEQNYVVAAADRGSTLRVAVTATNYDCNAHGVDCRYSSATAFSALTAVVPGAPPAPPPPPPPPPGPDDGGPISNAIPVVAGLPQLGETLTASTGDWSGQRPMGFAYSWSRCSPGCATIAGATGTTYTVGSADVGARLTVTVTATNVLGSAFASSAPTEVVAAVPSEAPVSLAPPAIFGAAKEGSTLTAVPGSWSGSPAPDFSFGWLRCERSSGLCLPILGADGPNYVLRAEDGGRELRAVVTASNTAGTATATSPPSGVVAPAGLLRMLDGTESVPASTVTFPDRLVIERARFRFAGTRTLVVNLHVADTRGYVVRGALVSIRPARAGETSSPRPAATSASGDATLRFAVSPAKLARGGSLVVVLRAAKPGDSASGSVAARVRVALRLISRR